MLDNAKIQLTMFTQGRDSHSLSETDKAYLAGFIDGEGCISIQKIARQAKGATPVYTLALVIASCDKDVLMYWREKTGLGAISTRKAQRENCRDGHLWGIRSAQAVSLLKEVYPYLMLKKEQADIAFQFQATMRPDSNWGNRKVGRGGLPVSPEVVHQRERYKQALTRVKGYLTKRGRPARIALDEGAKV